MYQIPILHRYSLIRIYEVSKLIVLILKKYFIGYLYDTPHIYTMILVRYFTDTYPRKRLKVKKWDNFVKIQ